MAITNGYCTLAEVKAAMRLTDSVDDTLIENSIEGASRRIDGYCGRFFFQTAKTVTFYANNSYRLQTPDLASSTLTLKTDNDGTGTYLTTWTAVTDYTLEPLDAGLQGRPYRAIGATGGKTFPLWTAPSAPSVQIAGTWGWPAVPDDVREACVLLTMRQFARYNAALGVLGFADMAITVRAVDPDVRDLLTPYKILGAI